MSVDEDQVSAANLAFYQAFESLDLTRMAAVWSGLEPVTCIHPGWPVARGRADVLATWRTIFQNTRDIRFRIDAEQVEVLGELAWVVCLEVLRSLDVRGGADGAVQATNVFRREQGAWKLVHHHGSPFVPEVRGAAAPAGRKGLVH